MSWDSYISDHLMVELPNSPGKTLTHAAIIGQDGGIWAKDAQFPDITPEQVAAIVKGFDDTDTFVETGILVGHLKFLQIAGDPGSVIRGRQGDSGICMKKTVTAFVVGMYGEGVQPGDCNVLVEGLGDYLKDMGV